MGDPPWCGLCRCPPSALWPLAMSADISFTKRAAAELSRCFNGLTVRTNKTSSSAAAAATTAGHTAPCSSANEALHQPPPPPPPLNQNRRRANRVRDRWAAVPHARTLQELWFEPGFLEKFFSCFAPRERTVLSQVCSVWRDILYQPKFWRGLIPVLRCRDLRTGSPTQRLGVYRSLERRGFDSLCLFGATDEDIYDLVSQFPPSHAARIRQVGLRCSGVTDKGLEVLIGGLPGITQLELSGCNEVTDAGLWASLTPRVVSLTLADCINVADETVSAITQLLPSLYELNLQAYHVTDASLAYFSPRQSNSLRILRLRSCWELTNHGILNLVHALPNLVQLSLSGCSKISDDGIELLAENLRHLRSLDLSWCPRISDGALEYIACDLSQLEELTLDRCVHITDIGLGYLSTMNNLCALYLRWCTQVRDYGVKHLCCMRNLQVLSLAGCSLITASGLSSLTQLRHLQELELTNCRGATRELIEYLHENLPHCLIIE